MSELHHAILGLPRSGKTTFLAALWHVIDAGEVDTKITLEKLVGNQDYLNAIVDAWRKCIEVPRTSSANESTVEIHVLDKVRNRKAILSFPDLSGESFEQQFATRLCRQDYIDGFSRQGGILLFINAERRTQGLTHADMQPFGPAEGPGADGGHVVDAKPIEWSPKLVPEQVQLVDLLQFIQMRPFVRRRRRVAVMISAWDVVPAPQPTPAEWLQREMPLLWQFLANNPESYEPRVYGISAQGGDVTSGDRKALAQSVPSKRIRCEGLDVEPNDLTAPLFWLDEDV